MSERSIALFEKLARDTWRRLAAAHKFDCSQGETTITDINLLDMQIAKLSNVRVYKAVGRDEPEKGFDWEWWIGRSGMGWWRYSVQAKKLDLKTGRYADLRHPVGSVYQIDILDDFGQAQQTIPLYCFYNHVPEHDAVDHWHCPLPPDPSQLGCSVVPLDIVRRYHDGRIRKDFSNLHTDQMAIPWRCLLRCPQFDFRDVLAVRHPLALNRQVRRHETLPSFLSQQDEEQDTVAIPGNSSYESDRGGYPERIMVVDLNNDE